MDCFLEHFFVTEQGMDSNNNKQQPFSEHNLVDSHLITNNKESGQVQVKFPCNTTYLLIFRNQSSTQLITVLGFDS